MTDETVSRRCALQPGSVHRFVLVGFMGAGKTSVGEEVAKRLGWCFADLDRLIESREKRTIPQIFEHDGEVRFRELECEILGEALAPDVGSEFLVLALGGGAFVSEKIRSLLRDNSVPAVWLDAPASELFRRCEQPDVVRPLRSDADQFAKLYEQRLSSYRQADYHVITTGKHISALAEEIIARLELPHASRSAE